jgi:LPXTG-motif cell wall-anchored protein
METFQQIMNWFYLVLIVAAIAIGAWLYKRRKEESE